LSARENLSGDAEQDYLGDGITENIITALSRVAISSNSRSSAVFSMASLVELVADGTSNRP